MGISDLRKQEGRSQSGQLRMSRKATIRDHSGSPERRQARRFPVGWAAKIKGLDAAGSGFEESSLVKDLSSTGAFVYINRQVRVGSELDVLIRVPVGRERWLKYPGRVIRVEESKTPADAGAKPRLGVAIHFSTFKPSFLSE